MDKFTRLLHKPMVWGALVGVIISAVGIGVWGPQLRQVSWQGTSFIKLVPEQLVYTGAAKPHLKLTVSGRHKSLSDLLAPTAGAANEPKVTVKYLDMPVDVPTELTPTSTGYDIELVPKTAIKPGTYDVTVTGTSADGTAFTQTTSFAWGVLAINWANSFYQPGETVTFQIGVLDSRGHTLCSAPIAVTVVDPVGIRSNLTYQNAATCQGDNFTNQPDYTATYVVGQPGKYHIKLSIKDTAYEISDDLTVVGSSEINIERSGVTRFNPNYNYGMSVKVTPTRDFNGIVTEILPDPRFEIIDNGGASVIREASRVVMKWAVSLKAGEGKTLAYTYHPPRQAPSYFILAPLSLDSTDAAHNYNEARGWQLAGDAAITFVKQTVGDSGATTTNPWNPAVTSTAGNTLVIVWGCACLSVSLRSVTVSDNLSQTWTLPSSTPGTNPPDQNESGGAITSVFFYGFIRNSSAITSLTLNEIGGTASSGFNVSEWSGIDNSMATLGNNSQPNNTGASWSATGAAVTLTTCDSPTTDELMGQGSWFCGHPDAYLVMTSIFAGKNSYSGPGSAYTALTQVDINGVNNNMAVAYKIISVSGSTNSSWTVTLAKNASSGIFALPQDTFAGTNRRQPLFWAK